MRPAIVTFSAAGAELAQRLAPLIDGDVLHCGYNGEKAGILLPRLFADGFPTADGRARFLRVEHREPAEAPDRRFPYVLTTGRLMAQ